MKSILGRLEPRRHGAVSAQGWWFRYYSIVSINGRQLLSLSTINIQQMATDYCPALISIEQNRGAQGCLLSRAVSGMTAIV